MESSGESIEKYLQTVYVNLCLCFYTYCKKQFLVPFAEDTVVIVSSCSLSAGKSPGDFFEKPVTDLYINFSSSFLPLTFFLLCLNNPF